tara:strand:- start:330 stop:509 length:180 start_codon:yes stop_codon:yes gene_type:complete
LSGKLSDSALKDWELETVARQNEVITARLEKQARRKQWQEANPDRVITSPQTKPPAATE